MIQTNLELYKYIDSLNKEKGKYTLDELYQIGIYHKNLPTKEKNWKNLSEYVGYNGTANAFRCFINSKQRKDGTLKVKDSNKILNDNNEYENHYKEMTQIRDIYNAYRLSLRDEARTKTFTEALYSAIRSIKPYEIKNIPTENYSKSGSEAILMFSDLHIGVNCNNFYNTYNSDIAFNRVKKLAIDTIRYCKCHNVIKLNVVNLGDLIHGLIHTSARLEQELDVVDQIAKAAEILSFMLIQLRNSGLKVTYRSCTDNHSRAISDKSQCIEKENFNKLIDMYVKIRTENAGIEFIQDNISESLGKFTLENGKKVMFAHGHLENPNKCIDAFMGATREFIDYVLLSHFHSSREKSYNGSRLIINGSIVGTESYALSKRLFSQPEQKLLIFEQDNFLDISINL